MGHLAVDGHQFRFSTLANQPRFARPGLGEHNAYVLGDLLGLSAAARRRLVEAGIVY
jgi:crotonobetainyl-CoA:carnitine CoA-transferase CaiB-like acyl-CoA transferase